MDNQAKFKKKLKLDFEISYIQKFILCYKETSVVT